MMKLHKPIFTLLTVLPGTFPGSIPLTIALNPDLDLSATDANPKSWHRRWMVV